MSNAAESLSEAEAVARLDALEDTDHVADDVSGGAEKEAQEVEGDEQSAEAVPPPTFWSRQDRALWSSVPPAVREAIARQEQQRTEHVAGQQSRQALYRREAGDQLKQLVGALQERVASWDAHHGKFLDDYVDRWSKVDFAKLAAEDPAEWTRLIQERDSEALAFRAAEERAEQDRKFSETLEAAHREGMRERAREQLARDLPREYGTPELAKATDKKLDSFLLEHGVPPASVTDPALKKLVLFASKYLDLKGSASKLVTSRASAGSSRASTRVVPGPSSNANRGSDAAESARARFHRSGGTDIDAAAELVRHILPSDTRKGR